MDRKTRLPIDPIAIKMLMKEQRLTYKKIEELSEGKITENSLKYLLSEGGNTDEATLDSLSSLLNCNKNDLVDKEYLLTSNLSFEINKIIQNLYLHNKSGDINRYYASEIKKFRTNIDLERMLNETHRLFLNISSDDYIFDKTAFTKTFDIINKDFSLHNCIANREFTEIKNNEAEVLYSKIKAVSGEYVTEQAILMFLYAFILFDAIFLEEEIASAVQLVPERKTEKADQFYELAFRSEKMRNALIDLIIYKNRQFDTPFIVDNEIDNTVIEGIILMLAACEKCYLHIHGNYADSEYINRAELSAILRKLEKIFIDLDIKLPEDYFYIDYLIMNTNRFGRYYNMLKNIFNSLNPPRKPKNKEVEYLIKGILINNLNNQQ